MLTTDKTSRPVASSRSLTALMVFLFAGAALLLGATGCDDPPDGPQPPPSADSTPQEAPGDEVPPAAVTTPALSGPTEPVDFMKAPEGHAVPPLGDMDFGPAKRVTAFFPAQANLQWLSDDIEDYEHPVAGEGTTTTHPGGALTAPCAECHTDGGAAPPPRELGERLVNTPVGVEGKRGFVDVDLRAAFDDEYLYLQASWQSQRPRPGITHQSFQFLDGHWERNTTGKDSDRYGVEHLEEDQFFDYEDRLAVMLAPEGREIRAFGEEGPSFDEIGCAVGCHGSMRNMPEAPAGDAVAAHPYLGDEGLGEDDIRHYLLHTRSADERYRADGAWDAIDADYDAEQDRADKAFLDLWQYRGARSAAMYGASNDYVMEYRFSGRGGVNYWFNQDPSSQADDADELVYDRDAHVWRNANGDEVDVSDYAWMYDITDTGFHALPPEAVDEQSGEISAMWARNYPLITQGPDRNAIPLEESLIGEGELVTRRTLRYATDVRGRTHAFSRWHPLTDTYTVVLRRPHSGTDSDHDTSVLLDGQNLTIAIAVFDDHSSSRFHHISFPLSVGVGDDADLRARHLR